MKFLLLSQQGDGVALARRLQENGHKSAVWIRDRRAKQNFDGLVTKIEKWEDFIDSQTVVWFDTTGGGKTAERLRAKGHHVFLGSVFADQLEHDRDTAFMLMEEVGIKVPEYHHFYSWEKARGFVEENPIRWAFKPSGEFGKKGDHLGVSSFMPSDAEELLGMMKHFEDATKGATPDFILQKFIEGDLTLSTEGWFNGNDFMQPFNHTVERKQLMNNNKGPSGGCSGNVVWQADVDNFVVKEGIAKMASTLRQFNYVGPIDLNTVVNDEGVWALEFTPRFGYDALPSFLELYAGDIGELIYKLAMGERLTEMQLLPGFAGAVRLSIPPYPSEEFTPNPGVPINGFTVADRPHIFFYEVMLNQRDELVTSGSGGTVAAVTGRAFGFNGALARPYDLAERAKIPDKQFRTDLADELERDYNAFTNRVHVRTA